MLGATVVLGLTFGALAGGKLMMIGRRRAMILSILLGFIGISITMIWSFKVILVGRFLFGLSAGMFSAIIPRYVEETVPIHLLETLAPCLNLAQALGGFFSYLLALILPEDEEVEELLNTDKWRIIYFYFPGSLFLVSLMGFIFVVKHDSIKNLINKKNTAEAKNTLCLVYKNCQMDTNVDAYFNHL